MMDYRDFKSDSGRTPESDKEAALREGYWWMAEDDTKAARSLQTTGEALASDNKPRSTERLVHARLFTNREMSGFAGNQYARAVATTRIGESPSRITFNVIASCVETLVSKVTKNKPRPSFLTDGGSWEMQQKAKQLTKFMNAVFYETKVHEKAIASTRDATVFGDGFLHVFINAKGRIECERVMPDEILVDDSDALHGSPRQLVRHKSVDLMVLLDTFGDTQEKRLAILSATVRTGDVSRRGRSDMVDVWEGWYLPCGNNKGRHVIAVNNVALVDEVWTLECFPFVQMHYRDPVVGFWGQGVAEILVGIQVEMNKLVRSISEQLRRKGRGRIFYPKNSINPEHLDNSVAPTIAYTGGVPPTVDNGAVVSPDEFAQIDALYQRAFQIVGTSELSAQGKKPSGLDAAVALREFNDIETERFAFFVMAYERFFMRFSELCLDLIREAGGNGYKVRLPNKRFLVELDFADIGLEKDDYVMQMFPVSSLPSTPGARLQRVEELRAGGYIDMPTAKKLLDFPDVDTEMNLANAADDDADASISMILDRPEPQMPDLEPYQDIDKVISRGTASYLYAKHHGCDEERLDMLRQYINMATAKKLEMMAPPPEAMTPMSQGVPPPVTPGAGSPVTNNVNVSQPLQPAVPPLVG
jgi:hypothetical protein